MQRFNDERTMPAPLHALATVGRGANLVFAEAFTAKCLMLCLIRLVQVMAKKEEEDKEGDGSGCDGRFKAGVQEFFERGLPWVVRKSGRAN